MNVGKIEIGEFKFDVEGCIDFMVINFEFEVNIDDNSCKFSLRIDDLDISDCDGGEVKIGDSYICVFKVKVDR